MGDLPTSGSDASVGGLDAADVSVPETAVDAGEPDACPKLDDKELCTKLGIACGAFGVSDPCRGVLTLQCGGCAEGEQCGLYAANTCAKAGDACVPETDTALCSRLGRACGGLTANDNCGSSRVITSCGTCNGGATCSPAGACTCEPETDADLCKAASSSCGAPKIKDRCGTERTVNCGNCTDGKSCVGDKTCACVPETNVAFCSRLGKDCGSVQALDNCGEARGADCGTCTGDRVCGLYAANVCGQQNCTPESDTLLCGRYNKNCGTITAPNNCGQSRTVDCGSCTGAQTCGAASPNVCGCIAETNSTFCTRLGKNCGSVTAQDNCGVDRTAQCGSCGTGDTCGSTVPNVCGCVSESDSTFCARFGKNCGALAGVDNCGLARSASCGACPSGQTCGVDSPNVCKCVPESDLSVCARYGKNCGVIDDFDNCGAPRHITSCGTCTSPQTCGTGNVCGCTTETDQAFCARLTKNCGQVTAFDNCGAQRTVASCGTCTSPQTCGAVTVNVCGCVAESDPTFCSRLDKNCGSVTAADNCGTQRTVASCGTCTSPQTCGAATANVCACVAESDSTFCSRLGKNCGSVTAADNCGTQRTVTSCGTCSGGTPTCDNGTCVAGDFTSCKTLKQTAASTPSGVQTTTSMGTVYCEMDMDGGGWTLCASATTVDPYTQYGWSSLSSTAPAMQSTFSIDCTAKLHIIGTEVLLINVTQSAWQRWTVTGTIIDGIDVHGANIKSVAFSTASSDALVTKYSSATRSHGFCDHGGCTGGLYGYELCVGGPAQHSCNKPFALRGWSWTNHANVWADVEVTDRLAFAVRY